MLHIFHRAFVGIILFFLSTYSFAKCIESTVRHLEFSKEITKELVLCFDELDSNFIQSQSCYESKTADCLAIKKIKRTIPVKLNKLVTSQGSPRSKLCIQSGGMPVDSEYKHSENSQWKQTEFCIFSDESFVNGALLMSLNKKALGLK